LTEKGLVLYTLMLMPSGIDPLIRLPWRRVLHLNN
jgi:hypothetical protein